MGYKNHRIVIHENNDWQEKITELPNLPRLPGERAAEYAIRAAAFLKDTPTDTRHELGETLRGIPPKINFQQRFN